MAHLKLYYHPISPPSRAVLLTSRALGVDLDLRELNLMAGEQFSPDFLAINPQHCIPTLVEDDEFVLWESRAICSYLVGQYGEDDALYPKDPKTRAKVDHLLYFDLGTLALRFQQYEGPVFFQGEEPSEEKLGKVQEALEWLDGLLAGHDWAVGDAITIADHSLAAVLATMEAIGIDLTPHAKLTAYLDRCKSEMPGYMEINVPGAEIFAAMFLARGQNDPEEKEDESNE